MSGYVQDEKFLQTMEQLLLYVSEVLLSVVYHTATWAW